MADELGASAILVLTATGASALQVSKAHPSVPIIAATPLASVQRRMALLSGVVPLNVPEGDDLFATIALARQAAVGNGMLVAGDWVVVVAGAPIGRGAWNPVVTVELIA
jgi:pyruvate kinase